MANLAEAVFAVVRLGEDERSRTKPRRGNHVNGEAAADLCEELKRGLARKGMTVEQLRRLSGLSRTTVSQALNRTDAVASAQTVARLSKALGLDEKRMYELRESAARNEPRTSNEAGRPIHECDPLDLEVHAAGLDRDAARALPGYVHRAHDAKMDTLVRAAVAGYSGMAVLVGGSSTGKTRACWEAVQPLSSHGWRLWHPYEPTHANALLAGINKLRPRTVVWLNDAQRYLDAGEEVAAALHRLLSDGTRAPMLVLASLWPDDSKKYADRPMRGQPDRYARARELLAGRRIDVSSEFVDTDLIAAQRLASAGDRLWAGVLARTHNGRVTQQFAGGPELVRRYGELSAPAKAMVRAAMDACRFGTGPRLKLAFLAGAAQDYLHDDDLHVLEDEDWLEHALAELAAPVHGDLAPLRRVPLHPDYRLADYLEEHGRRERRLACPPLSFWQAAADSFSDPQVLANLGIAAEDRHRLSWAETLYKRAADGGNMIALGRLSVIRDLAGDRANAEAMARRAARYGNTRALGELANRYNDMGERKAAVRFAQAAAEAGDTSWLVYMTMVYEETGDPQEAERVAKLAADSGDESAFDELADMRKGSQFAGVRAVGGDQREAERLVEIADAGHQSFSDRFTLLRWSTPESGRVRIADDGDIDVVGQLIDETLPNFSELDGESVLAHFAGSKSGIVMLALAWISERAGETEAAEDFYRRAVDCGSALALGRLAVMRERAGRHEDAEAMAVRAADAIALVRLSRIRETAGDLVGAERLAVLAAECGSDVGRLNHLALRREKAGDRETAERLAVRSAENDRSLTLCELAVMRENAGDQREAERLAIRALDAGSTMAVRSLAEMRQVDALWPFGLEPDGTPSPAPASCEA
jgi:transcriptional regulator with XRE-family HTH domain